MTKIRGSRLLRWKERYRKKKRREKRNINIRLRRRMIVL